MTFTLLAICTFTCVFSAQAQLTGSISGVVTSCRTNLPIMDVFVSTKDVNGNIISDTTSYTGYYCLDSLLPNRYDVTFQYGEYEKVFPQVQRGILDTCLCLNSEDLKITTESFPVVIQGNEFHKCIEISGGCPPLSYTYTGMLPQNLKLDTNTGCITGTIKDAAHNIGIFEFKIIVEDSEGRMTSKVFQIQVVPISSFHTSQELNSAIINQPFAFQIVAKGGLKPYDFSYEGSFPTGLTLSDAGYISGVPTREGAFSFMVYCSDKSGQEISKNYTMKIVQPLVITTQVLYDGIYDKIYNMKLSAEGGYGQIHWGTNSSLPTGMSMDQDSGVFSGIPLMPGKKDICFVVTDEDGHTDYHTYTFHVSQVLKIQNIQLPNALIGKPYREIISVDEPNGKPPYTFEITGKLPSGLTFEDGIISGTPDGPEETTQIEITVKDSTYPEPQTDNQLITINVVDKLTILNSTFIQTVRVNEPLTRTLSENDLIFNSGGSFASPFYWELVEGALPQGTNFIPQPNGNGAAITGIPKVPGDFFFALRVTDSDGNTAEKKFYWRILADLQIITLSIPKLYLDDPVDIDIKVSGGMPPYKWTISKPLPQGLSFNTSTGKISGTPTQKQDMYGVVISVEDSFHLPKHVEHEYRIEIKDDILIITTHSLPDTRINESYETRIEAKSDTPPYYWRFLDGPLPPGLEMKTGNNIIIKGRPNKPGIYPLRFSVSDANEQTESVEQSYTITVYDVIRIVSTSLEDGYIGKKYSDTIDAEGPRLPYTYILKSGSLPPGITMNQITGQISGVPGQKAEIAYPFEVRVAKSGEFGSFDEADFIIGIKQSDTITITTNIENMYYEEECYFPLGAEGGLKPYHWHIAEGYLPDGIILGDTAYGMAVYGTPSQGGHFLFKIQVHDSSINPLVASKMYSFTIDCDDCETTPPGKPELIKSYPTIKGNSNGIVRVLLAPHDELEMAGFSYVWNQSERYIPDNSVETVSTDIISPQLMSDEQHYLHIRAVDVAKNASETLSIGPFYVTRPSGAVIIVGGNMDSDLPDWPVTQQLTQDAYDDFYNMGYAPEQIYYAIHSQTIDDVDESFDHSPVNALIHAITSTTGVSEYDPLYIYIQGPFTSEGSFWLNQNASISAQQLNQAFAELNDRTGCQIIVILEGCYSGIMMSTLKGYGRIIIASAGDVGYLVDQKSRHVFSRYLFSKLKDSENLYQSFIFAKDRMRDLGYPEPLMDDMANDNMAKNVMPVQYSAWADQPVIESVSVVPENNVYSFQAVIKNHNDCISMEQVVVAMILPETDLINNCGTIDFKTIPLNADGMDKYSGFLSEPKAFGTYRFVFQAQNNLHEWSDPYISHIEKTILAGDIDHNGAIQLNDAILALMAICDMKSDALNADVDVNGDSKIGLAEAIYVLGKVGSN